MPDVIAVRGSVVREDSILADGVVVIAGSRIDWVGPADQCPSDVLAIASQAAWVLPGLVDLHNHGGGGFGFPEADALGCRTAIGHHRALGTTTLLASLVSAPVEVLEQRLAVLADLTEAGEIAGVHLEGPFLAAGQCGAQDPDTLIPGSRHVVERLLAAGRGSLRSMTMAPEVPGFAAVVETLRQHRVLPSLGHTAATAAVTSAAIRAAGPGPLSATHLFNAMSPWQHRNPGAVAACLAAAARGDMVVELIGDGVHLSDETVRMVFELVGPDRIALVSDAMAAAGMPDGRYSLGSMDVQVADGVARLAPGEPGEPGELSEPGANAAIAGGTSSLAAILRRAVRAGVPMRDAVRSATAVPAGLLGLADTVGRLVPGLQADLVVLDDDLTPTGVIRRGGWLAPPSSLSTHPEGP